MTDAKKMQEAAAKLVEDALKDAGDHPTANAMRRVYADLAAAIRALPLPPQPQVADDVAGDRKDVLIQILEGQLKEGDGERIKLAACLLEERLNHIETRARAEKAEARATAEQKKREKAEGEVERLREYHAASEVIIAIEAEWKQRKTDGLLDGSNIFNLTDKLTEAEARLHRARAALTPKGADHE